MVLYGCVLWSFTLIHQTWKSCHIKSSLEASKTLPKNDAIFFRGITTPMSGGGQYPRDRPWDTNNEFAHD